MFHRRSSVTLACFLSLILAQACQIQDPPRVTVVGASVTAGFRLESLVGFVKNPREYVVRVAGREVTDAEYVAGLDSIKPSVPLSAVYGTDVVSNDDEGLFMQPEKVARKLLEETFKDEVDLVLGVDLLFWFGYGNPRAAEPGTKESMQWRVDLQAKGLALLGEFAKAHPETTFVVGDYPDLTGAVPLMITKKMIPTSDERAELNRRLAQWCDVHQNIYVFTLSKSLQSLRSGKVRIEVAGKERVVDVASAFQFARVHPTRLGVAVLVRDLARFLTRHVDARLRPRHTEDQVIVAACGVK